MSITLIACVDMNFGIADEDGNLLFKLPKDLQHFKSITSGKVIVMGRKTWDSLPKKPLEKRKNYVLTRDKSFNPTGAKVIHSIDEVIKLSKTHDVFIIGGGEVYEQFIDLADKLIMTHVHVVDHRARVFFPDFSYKEWDIIENTMSKHEEDNLHAHSFTFTTYVRKENT